jgi:hypothetical protein
MYVNPATYGTVCAFITGFDMARDGGPLNGLQEWLVVRSNGGNNLHWSGLAGDLIPGGDDEVRRIAGLGDLLDEFFRHRNADGVSEIFCAYGEWSRRQSWYRTRLRD